VKVVSTCPAPGSLGAGDAGPFSLGVSGPTLRKRFTQYTADAGLDDFCVASGAPVRVGFPSAKLLRTLSAAQRRRYSDRSILLLSGNPAYRLSSLATGTHLTAAIKRRFKLGSGLVIGKHTWFVLPHSGAAAGLVQVHGATVTGVGLISAGLTGSTQRDRGLLGSFG
jgi:hypothetical protein